MNAEQFLYHEARLLDTQQYEAWLELFTDDATYWVPLEREQKDPFETSSIIHDDRTLLGLRVKQARHPRAHARLPLARSMRSTSSAAGCRTPTTSSGASAWRATKYERASASPGPMPTARARPKRWTSMGSRRARLSFSCTAGHGNASRSGRTRSPPKPSSTPARGTWRSISRCCRPSPCPA